METGYRGSILLTDKKTVLGIDLGADFTAEHEWGIKGLMRDFGLPLEKKLGYDALKVTKVPSGLWHGYVGDNNSLLIYRPYLMSAINGSVEKTVAGLIKDTLSIERHNPGKGFVGAWDESSFGINVDMRVQPNVPRELFVALVKRDVVIGMQKGKFTANSGLTLQICSRIPEEEKERFRKEDKQAREQQRLFNKLEKESGVIELLEGEEKRYFSLHIRRLDDKGQPLWWLNPEEQGRYNSGWFSTQDLRDWAEDKGKVVKAKVGSTA